MILSGPAIAALLAALSGAPATTSSNTTSAELDRLVGLRVDVGSNGYQIVDVAGEGAPLVGCVKRDGPSLYFENSEHHLRLVGPLAVPRIAGPNYKVWIMGHVEAGEVLRATRLGILSDPSRSGCTTLGAGPSTTGA